MNGVEKQRNMFWIPWQEFVGWELDCDDPGVWHDFGLNSILDTIMDDLERKYRTLLRFCLHGYLWSMNSDCSS